MRVRLSELRKNHRESELATSGPLLDLILKDRRRPSRSTPPEPSERPRANLGTQRNSRRAFLVQFEATGDIEAGARAAGCSVAEVRQWRTSDPMFNRDFALAAMNYVRALKARVESLAEQENGQLAEAARAMLASERQHVGPDGRLDVRAWRDALEGFLRASGISGLPAALHAAPAHFGFELAF